MTVIEKYKKIQREDWCVVREGYELEEEANLETVFTLSNGYMGIRGAIELPSLNKAPGTYVAGVFDKPEVPDDSVVCGLTLQNKAITPAYAIMPDTNLFEIHADGDSFDFMNGQILACRKVLDMRRGMTVNTYTIQSRKNRILNVSTLTMVSKARKHVVLYRVEVTPMNFQGNVTVSLCNSLCTTPQFIPRLKDYISRTDCAALKMGHGYVSLLGSVTQTGAQVCVTSHTRGDGARHAEYRKDGICEVFETELAQGQTAQFVKMACLYTTRDCEDVEGACLAELERAEEAGEEALRSEHFAYWDKRWRESDVAITGDPELQLGIRWNVFHLMQLGSEDDTDISISATGLHGQGYFGHAFWDTEIFMLPFYLATNVEVARCLLMYRYNRLDEARRLAAEAGCQGAKFPWTSAFTGADVTPPDWERCANRQIHISGDIAYAFRNFYDQTGDKAFYESYGIELVVETAKFYACKAEKGTDGKYHILDVIGPDEYNIHADDNYYTNHMVQWNLREAVTAMKQLSQENPECFARVAERTGWDADTAAWLSDVAENIAYPQTRNYVNEQYTGFFAQKDPGEILRDSYNMPVNKNYEYAGGTQILKQADVVMMHYLFPGDFSKRVKKESFRYYEKRCLHGSSLSPSIHCIVGLRNGFGKYAYGYLYLTALLDLKNLHLDKNLFEGLHTACAGGTWAAAVYGFGGVEISKGRMHINPILPEKWTQLKYVFRHKGVLFDVCVQEDSFTVQSSSESEVWVNDKRQVLAAGQSREFMIDHSRYVMK